MSKILRVIEDGRVLLAQVPSIHVGRALELNGTPVMFVQCVKKA